MNVYCVFKMRTILFYSLFIIAISSLLISLTDDQDNLPVLGDYSSASVSLSGEYDLGRLWLAMYRSSIKEHDDPMIRTYLEDLLYRLSENSEVQDRRFEFIVLQDKTINALRHQEE